MKRPRNILLCLLVSLAAVACDEEDDSDTMAAGTGGGDECAAFEFVYEGEPEDGVCPRLECCPDNPDGTFSAFSNGMCLSEANCEAVCEDPDLAFECL